MSYTTCVYISIMGRTCVKYLPIIVLLTLGPLTAEAETQSHQADPECIENHGKAKECGPIDCINGLCIHSDNHYRSGVGGSVYCQCFEGWVGSKCSICCDLQCKHGECILVSEHEVNQTKCQCNRTHTGELCDEELCLRQCNKGDCTFVEGRQECNCNRGFSGPDCDIIKRPVSFWVGVSVLVFLIIVLLGTMAIMPYVMWRKRALIVLKIHYYFQQYEDDDSSHFDAFISYGRSEEDAQFVINTLVPILEGSLGFKTCYSDRNFVYGAAHIDNIVAAVGQSRRTILVISPRYLEDEWPVFEALTAQMRSLSSAHKIIPIIFRDVKVDHPTLKNILASLRSIKWPHDGTEKDINRFCKRLSYGMPKLKQRDN